MTDSGSGPQHGERRGDLGTRDLEMIAAFIDRRLNDEERLAFMRRLDEEETLYEVFVETVRYRDQANSQPAEVIEHPSSRRRWPRIAAVAALVAAAVTPVVLLDRPAARYAGQLVAGGVLGEVLDEGWLVRGWSTMRGPDPGTDEFDAAFRLGVRQVDLEVALRLGRERDAARLTGEIDRLLAGLELAEVMQLLYAEVAQRLADSEKALAQAEENDAELRRFLGEAAPAYELGQWAEAGVLAARSGNTELLGSRSFQRALAGFPRDEWPGLAAQLDAIAGQLEAPAERLDLARLEADFSALIEAR